MSQKNKKAPEAKTDLTKAAEDVKEKAEDIKEKAEDAAEDVKEKAEDIKEKAEGESYKGILGDYEDKPEEDEVAIGDGPKLAEPKEKKPANKKVLAGVGIAASVVLVGCLSVIGVRAMQANKPIPVLTSDHFTIDKDMLTCYYHDMLNMFREYYGEEALLSYYQLDLSKSLKEQEYPAGDGSTWFDNIILDVLDTAKQQLVFAEAGKEAGYELSPEDLKKVNEAVANADLSTYGEGITKSDLRSAMMIQAYSAAYYNYYLDNMTFTDDEIQAYYDANTDNYVTCGIMGFSINYEEEAESSEASSAADESTAEESTTDESTAEESTTDESTAEESTTDESAAEESATDESAAEESSSEAKSASSEESSEDTSTSIAEEQKSFTRAEAEKLANELKACKNPEEFEKKVREILKLEGTSEEEIDLRIDATKSDQYPYTQGSEVGEWAFKSGAKVNDTLSQENGNAFYVYMITSEPSRDESNIIDVRHILFATSQHTGEAEDDAATALEECRKLAKDTLAEWEAGDRTEDSFAALATEKTEDPGSKDNGGLYQNVYVGQMVPTFNDWCFDPARKAGDTGIVETDYGVHVMYFVKNNGAKWKNSVKNTLMSQAYEKWMAEIQAKYSVDVDADIAKTIDG